MLWFVIGAFFVLLTACSHPGKDSHTEVFKTAQDVATERLARQLQAHKELAVSVLRFARPDVEAKPAEKAAITVAADGVTQTIDLGPIEEQLLRHQNEERAILRRYLEEKLQPFDVERLKALGFEKVQGQSGFLLVNSQTFTGMQRQWIGLVGARVVGSIYRVAVVRRQGTEPPVTVPITQGLADAWHVSPDRIDQAALANLRRSLSAVAGEELIETLAFGPRGKSGSLKSAVDPAVILLPEFLTAVQKAWGTGDNLVLFVPSPSGITFVEEHNQKLQELLVPQWKKILVSTPSPLSEQFVLREAEKISLYAYTPATQPATKPATKPAPYIVH